ncbi:MAG: OsmC family protein [Alcaligenaceae bacterium]|nr:OsmC family protein [Alcaligenaceae bacterium]
MPVTYTISQLSPDAGRYLLNARDQHLVVDASESRGGQGQAWQAAELLLGALQTCSHAVIGDEAAKRNWVGYGLKIEARSETDDDRPGHYRVIELDYRFTGLNEHQAQELVDTFTAVCPIYGSLARGSNVTIRIHTT